MSMDKGICFTGGKKWEREDRTEPLEDPPSVGVRVCADPFDTLALEHERRRGAGDDSH